MKNIGFFFAIFLFSCTKKEEPKDQAEIRSFTNVDTYIEKDSTTLFFGKETLKLIIVDSLIEYNYPSTGYSKPRCTSNLLEIENLTDKTVKIIIYSGLAPTSVEWKRTEIQPRRKSNEKFDLGQNFSCSSGLCCGNASVLIPKMKVTYN
jgi:hypothetical protein